MNLPDDILTYALDALERLVAIPSVAAEGRGIPEAADLVQELLEDLGFEVAQHETPGAPVVYAEKKADSGPTVLFYNHYDVQPADPLELWDSDPFSLRQEGGKLYGRGASDDKGELVSRLAAIKWFQQKHGELPFTAKFLVEGEEEVGSPNLAAYIKEHKELLKADACIWEFGGTDADGQPVAYCGLKGIVALELFVKTAGHDLHSSYGAVIENPIYLLAAAIASLRDENGQVLVEGFYDDVAPPSDQAKAYVDALSDDDRALAEAFDVKAFIGGVRGKDMQRRLIFEPAINFNGFHAGYGGEGSKTVLPAEAFAKLDIRLVPDQSPAKIIEALKAHLSERGFDEVEVRVTESGMYSARSDLAHPWIQAAVAALQDVYGQEPAVYPNSAGSGPMYPFIETLGVPVVGIGCSYPGSRIHSPNEHMLLEHFKKGTASVVRALERFTLEHVQARP